MSLDRLISKFRVAAGRTLLTASLICLPFSFANCGNYSGNVDGDEINDTRVIDNVVVAKSLLDEYDGWKSIDEKRNLFEGIFEEYNIDNKDDKKRIKILAHQFWLEKENDRTNYFPWLLNGEVTEEMKESELEFTNLNYDSSKAFFISKYILSNIASETHKVFPIVSQIIEDAHDSKEAIGEVIKWMQKNSTHYYISEGVDGTLENWDFGIYCDNCEFDDLLNLYQDLSIEKYFQERVSGCHLMSYVLSTMFRSVGIPAIYDRTGGEDYGHGVVYLPTLNKYIDGDMITKYIDQDIEKFLFDSQEVFFNSHKISERNSEIDNNKRIHPRISRMGNQFYIEGIVKPIEDDQSPEEFREGIEKELFNLQAEFPEYDLYLSNGKDGCLELGSNKMIDIEYLE